MYFNCKVDSFKNWTELGMLEGAVSLKYVIVG